MIITRFDEAKEFPTSEGTIKPLFASDSLKVVFMKIPAGLRVPLHSHAGPDNFLLLRGEVKVTSRESALLGEGDLVHIPGGQPFSLESRTDAEALLISTPPSPGREHAVHVHEPCVTHTKVRK